MESSSTPQRGEREFFFERPEIQVRSRLLALVLESSDSRTGYGVTIGGWRKRIVAGRGISSRGCVCMCALWMHLSKAPSTRICHEGSSRPRGGKAESWYGQSGILQK
jgi:hypothetical protein